MPMSGTYVYRSAMACDPICTSPITGTRVPMYHTHPTAAQGFRFKALITNKDMDISKKHAPAVIHPDTIRGCGYKTARL